MYIVLWSDCDKLISTGLSFLTNLYQGSDKRGFFGIRALFAHVKTFSSIVLATILLTLPLPCLTLGDSSHIVVHLSGRNHVKAGAQFNEPKLYSPSREIFLRCPLYAMQCRHIDSAEDPWSIGASFTKSPQKMVKRRSFRFLWKLLDRSVRLLVPSRNLHFAWETGRWSQLFWCPSAILAMCSSLIDR